MGFREGITKSFYDTGNLWTEQNYKKNMLDGETKIYRNDSSLWYIETYENGKLVLSKEYSEDGKLIEEKDLH